MNRSLQMTVVKNPKKGALQTENADRTESELEAIKKMVTKDNIRFAAITVVSVVASCVLLKTASEIAINYAPKN